MEENKIDNPPDFKQMGEGVARMIWPNGDSFFVTETRKGEVIISYTNDYPLQHGSGQELKLPKKVVKCLYAILKFKEAIPLKIKESVEKGDGECNGSAYWYQCGLYDALQILINETE